MNKNIVQIEEFLKAGKALPVLDVRSPSEYHAGHIPGANSLPLFTDEERAIVGTLYKKRDKKTAIKKGLQIVGPKMLGFVESAEALGSEEICLYCWRGGMRSDSMAWLMERYGFKTTLLLGGYKSYRNALHQFFEQNLPLHVLSGFTGSKKTVLLHLMKANGEQIIDLEGLANHQGSRFGNIKSLSQPTTEQFQNQTFDAFSELDLSRPIWIEDENMRIGQVNLIESLHQQKNESPHFFLDVEKDFRLDFLMEDYGDLNKDELIDATSDIRKKLGFDKAKMAKELIESGDLRNAAAIILDYYDKCYLHSITAKKHLVTARFKPSASEWADMDQFVTRINQSLHAV